MTMEVNLAALVEPLLAGGLWPDIADIDVDLPYATFHQVGGQTVDPIDGSAPGLWCARVQINVWSMTRNEANTKMRAIEEALRASPFNARPVGALRAEYNEVTKVRGAMQDFEVWWNT
jgi:hypothetical protein